MSSDGQNKGLTIGLSDIKVLRFNVREVISEDQSSLSYSDINNDFTFNFKDLGENQLQLFIHYAMFHETEENKSEILHTDVIFIFNILDLTNNLNSDRDHIGMTVVSVAFSTLRGIIFERTMGFNVNKIIMPIINPLEFWKEMKETGMETVIHHPAEDA